MSRFLHVVNFRKKYLESKGPPDTRLENPPSANLAPPGDLEESASHHMQICKYANVQICKLGQLPLVEGGGFEALSSRSLSEFFVWNTTTNMTNIRLFDNF